MATLEELRKWARGRRVAGLPNPLRRKPVSKPAARPGEGRGYRINPEADDALLLFGRFRGSRASELVRSARGRKYLRWILEGDFDGDLKNVCRYRLELWKRGKKKT